MGELAKIREQRVKGKLFGEKLYIAKWFKRRRKEPGWET
jgi:hypothetical protein